MSLKVKVNINKFATVFSNVSEKQTLEKTGRLKHPILNSHFHDKC